ncbi:carbohydrate ABC transporter permease [Xylanimonas protaetiae]|uniref:Maltose/maltodextrin transport system permease protein n=1 Tax=Xylanimonas protaetiae TaxID=2509457 RepID=A0A4P6F7M6_9MICO|nr:sugar ABC transporter permease [Xylanimonas protaetiae]QAY71456.1 sugar ABC transporter permease [Xylanimonas protaetiae]
MSATLTQRDLPLGDTDVTGTGRCRTVLVLACAFMGLAHLTVLRQWVKGATFALVEILLLTWLPLIVKNLRGLVTLGEQQLDVPVRFRQNSLFMLVDGVMTITVLLLFAAIYYISVRSALAAERSWSTHGVRPREESLPRTFLGKAFPIVGLTPTVVLVAFFVVVPLVFAALVAFTNYSAPQHIPPANTIDWVGLENFRRLFGGSSAWTGALGRVFAWTLVWAVLATVTCYFGGMLMAVLVQESKFKITPLLRAVFILPYAIPGVVSMLFWNGMLNGAFGTVNRTLQSIGLIDGTIPWLSDPWLAKFTVVTINLWAGFPYFMLLIIGTMTAIPADIIEAAQIDGASKWQVFRRVTLPLVMYQTAPLMIISFAHNLNNFGAIFFLTGGGPAVADTTTTGAGGTDIMVSWIYKLTITLLQYGNASVLAIVIFVLLAPVAIFNFRRTKSYKEGEL